MICDDAGGGRPRDGKFPRSMSDFKPGDEFTLRHGAKLCFSSQCSKHRLLAKAGKFEYNDEKHPDYRPAKAAPVPGGVRQG